MDLTLENSRVLIVGGSRGIGLAVAKRFATEGARVAICGRSQADLDKAQALLPDTAAVKTFSADATQSEALDRVLNDLESAWAGVDIVVSTVSAMCVTPGDEAWKSSFETDIMSFVRLVRRCLPTLKASKAGAVVLIGSTASTEASPIAIGTFGGEQPYGAVKAALVNYVKNMALELVPQGVRINVVSPGNVFIPGGPWDQLKQAMPDLYEKMLGENPMGRMAKPEEIADCVAFMASPRAQFVTGQNLIVDGGLTRRAGG